jgi:hypothetical protein|tara:strand:- start:2085 stop:2744 length:660 start_codon:yes stop_codon:yes gene_type:complete
MSASFTLATLKTAIKERAEDVGAQFAASLDVIIQLAENRILRELPLSVWQLRGNVTITQGSQTAAKPTDAIAIHDLIYTDSAGVVHFLKPRSWAYCQDYAPNTTQGTPKYYAEDYSETHIYIAPSPNLATTATALYTKHPNSIVTDTTGTFISQKMADLLLSACMVQAEQYDIAPDIAKMWEANYDRLLIGAAREFAHLLPRNYTGMAPIPSATGNLER